MWNEPNHRQFWKPKPDAEAYARLATDVGKAIRAVAPDELFVGPATSTIDLPFLEECFKAGLLEHWDAVSVHPYRQGDPETVNAEYRKLRALIARYAPKKNDGLAASAAGGNPIPILSGEWGYSSAWANFDADRQAKYLPRQLLTNLYNEIPISIWYDWHDDGRDPKEAEHNFGTVRHEYRKGREPVYEPKPAYLAMRTLTRQLGGFTYNKRLALESTDDYVLLFSKGQETRLAAWTTAKTPREVTLPASAGKFTVTDHLGAKAVDVRAADNGVPLTLTDTVQYLVPEKPNDLLRVAAAWTRMPLEAETLNHYPDRDWHNPLDRPITLLSDPPLVAPPGGRPRFQKAPFLASEGVGRTTATHRRVRTWDVEGLGWISQETVLASKHPLDATLLPPVYALDDDKLPAVVVRIDNPSKRAVDLDVHVKADKGLYWPEAQKPFQIEAGADHAYVTFDMGCPASAVYGATVSLRGEKDRVVAQFPTRTYRSVLPTAQLRGDGEIDLADLAPAKIGEHLKVTADGDRAVRAEHTLSLARSPREKEPKPEYVPHLALKLTYALDAGWKFLELKPQTDALKKIEGRPKSLGLWVHGDNAGTQLRLRFTDATGQTFQPSAVKIDFNGWRYVTIPMTPTPEHEFAHWGGKADGEIRYPIRWNSLLLLDNPGREKVSGELWFAGLTLIE